jgi:hypothetical protein
MAYMAGRQRQVWGFDSFEGMPELTENDAGSGQNWVGISCVGEEGVKAVSKTFSLLGVSMKNVNLVKGWFEDTLENAKQDIGPIAILRLDNDWYASTRFCLETLYDSVIPGGVVIIDDYFSWEGCRKAVDEFRDQIGETAALKITEKNSEVFWHKTDSGKH